MLAAKTVVSRMMIHYLDTVNTMSFNKCAHGEVNRKYEQRCVLLRRLSMLFSLEYSSIKLKLKVSIA